MATETNGGGNGVSMVLLVVALVIIIGIFAYYMAHNRQQTAIIQTPSAPQVAIPTPAKQPAQ